MGTRGSMTPIYKKFGKEKRLIGYNIGGNFTPIEKYVKIPISPKYTVWLDPMCTAKGEKKVEFPQKKSNFLRRKSQ